MIAFTLYTANCTGNLQNCLYPNKVVVQDKDSFVEAIRFDHVSAEYKDNYRSNTNFIKADNIVLDCDNDHSDDPKDWVSAADVAIAFPGVSYAIAYSRNHLREKANKSPRPRFHVYFTTPTITDQAEYTDLKQEVAATFPFFDTNALDSARFIFGSDKGEVEISPGQMDIAWFLEDSSFTKWDETQEEIPQGKRNSTMSHYAGKVIKRFGNTEEAHSRFLKQAKRCNPPLEDSELNTIWNSAVSFGKKVAVQAGYIPPEVYNSDTVLKPAEAGWMAATGISPWFHRLMELVLSSFSAGNLSNIRPRSCLNQ
jgi:putative DNA primase/helicase